MTEKKLTQKQQRERALKDNAHQHVEEIMQAVAKPDGYARLTQTQRKFLLAAVLGSMVPADSKVKDVELQRIKTHLATKYFLAPQLLDEALVIAHEGLSGGGVEKAAKSIAELLNIDDRINLIGLLWDIALCDLELAQEEENLVYKVADLAQVPRKKVVEQQARVAKKGYS
jgi:uncharacterized tellurite resistance protein B-like protein